MLLMILIAETRLVQWLTATKLIMIFPALTQQINSKVCRYVYAEDEPYTEYDEAIGGMLPIVGLCRE